jgi:hypothetical protein
MVHAALLDSGSTQNFIDLEAAAHVGLQFGDRFGLQVVVANGDRVLSPGCCCNVSFTIGTERFIMDFYRLAHGSYEMVLDIQWLESLGSMLWDFTKRLLTFTHGDHEVCWKATNTPIGEPSIAAAVSNIMVDLLLHYEGLFTTLIGLPPQCTRCHQIRLLLGTPPVAVRPYRYAHAQKTE